MKEITKINEEKEKKIVEKIHFEFSLLNKLKNNSFSYFGNLTIDDLSAILHIKSEVIINFFWDLGKMLTKNQILSDELISLFCQKKGFKAIKISSDFFNINEVIKKYISEIDEGEELSYRPPIISIMGHVDHGKTTLLSTITQKNFKEAGEITQKINVLQKEFQNKKITFCDTPGHRIFIQMRQHGISFTDLVVLVISAEDGIMPQTIEIIQYINQYSLPTIIFVNHRETLSNNSKINLEKVKRQLMKQNLTHNAWGEIIIVSGSAREEENAKILLENILLFNDLWKSNYKREADGIIIDSYLSSQKGLITKLLIQGGKLQKEDWIIVSGREGKVKRILNESGKSIDYSMPSEVVDIIGLDFLAESGEKFLVINKQEIRKEIVKLIDFQEKNKSLIFSGHDEGDKIINLIIFADSKSSLKALEFVIEQNSFSSGFFQIIYKRVGDLNSFASELARKTPSYMIFFSKLNNSSKKILKENKIEWIDSQIIYQIEEWLKIVSQGKKEKKQVEKIMGESKIEKVFYFSKIGKIAGCKVIKGIINRNNLINIIRQGKQIISAEKIRSLESNKITLSEVREGQEFAITLINFDDFQEGDQIINYKMIKEDDN